MYNSNRFELRSWWGLPNKRGAPDSALFEQVQGNDFAIARKNRRRDRGTFLVVQPVHLHQHTRAARARKSANMVSANMVSILPNHLQFLFNSCLNNDNNDNNNNTI